ncbi:MAG: TIGR01459 family HAD-type hydrolase [Natronohydrobacter sp.]|nr:TIGR01459 family HAD-type hydrolase [Natronohydrobacter sp.]
MGDWTTLMALAGRYDAFLVDQFGVLLDGQGAYPAAPAALAALVATGKPVLMLSNSGKRSAPNMARLGQFGFAVEGTRGVLSSGEVAFRQIADDLASGRIAAGSPVWLHARDGDISAIDGLDLVQVSQPDKAAVIVIAGSQGDQLALEWYRERLLAPAQRGVPAYCTNPDLEMLSGGARYFGAGAIAALYAELGGPVRYIGKPWPLIYQVALRHLGQADPARVLCIGDSPAHDVRGGRDAGMATALVTGTGLHSGLAPDALENLCAQQGAVPDHYLTAFQWSDGVSDAALDV